ncbi:hypothetical protein LXL04_014449 [Taraxacum kok-saghyz]
MKVTVSLTRVQRLKNCIKNQRQRTYTQILGAIVLADRELCYKSEKLNRLLSLNTQPPLKEACVLTKCIMKLCVGATESGRTEFDVGLRLRPDRVRHQTLLPNAQTKDRVRHLRQNLSLRHFTTDRVRGKTSDPGLSLTSQERYQTLGLRSESVVRVRVRDTGKIHLVVAVSNKYCFWVETNNLNEALVKDANATPPTIGARDATTHNVGLCQHD